MYWYIATEVSKQATSEITYVCILARKRYKVVPSMRRTPMEHISQVYKLVIWNYIFGLCIFWVLFKPYESVSSITEGRRLSISHPALHQTGRPGPHTGDTAATDVLVTPTNNTKTSWKRYACDVISLVH